MDLEHNMDMDEHLSLPTPNPLTFNICSINRANVGPQPVNKEHCNKKPKRTDGKHNALAFRSTSSSKSTESMTHRAIPLSTTVKNMNAGTPKSFKIGPFHYWNLWFWGSSVLRSAHIPTPPTSQAAVGHWHRHPSRLRWRWRRCPPGPTTRHRQLGTHPSRGGMAAGGTAGGGIAHRGRVTRLRVHLWWESWALGSAQ